MSCEMMRELLEAYADRQASAAEAAQVESHLESCAACRKGLRWIAASKIAIRQVETPAMPKDLKRALLEEAARRQPAVQMGWLRILCELWQKHPWQAGLATACAAAAVLLIARLSGPRSETLPLDVVLAAHNEYARTLPLANEE